MQVDLQGRALAIWAPAAVLTVSALAFWWSSRRSSKDTQEGDLHLIPTATDTVPILGRVSVIRVRYSDRARQPAHVTHMLAFSVSGGAWATCEAAHAQTPRARPCQRLKSRAASLGAACARIVGGGAPNRMRVSAPCTGR